MRFSPAARLLGVALAFSPAVASAQQTQLVSTTDANFTVTLQSLVSAAGNVNTDPRYQTPISPAYNGVGYIQITTAIGNFACTGSLLEDGKSVLTAAHCLSGLPSPATSVLAAFYDSNGNFRVLSAAGWNVHPSYSNKVIDENDIAVIHLAAEAPSTISRYKIYTGQAENKFFEFVGFGKRGSFGVGTSGVGSGAGGFQLANRKSGENLFDITMGDSRWNCPVGSPYCAAGTNFFTQLLNPASINNSSFGHILLTDFDNGTTGFASNDAMCMVGKFNGQNQLGSTECNKGLGLEEAISGSGDSGGPGFVDGKIASVTSFGLTFGSQTGDIDGTLDSSFGEYAGFTDVAFHEDWIEGQMDLNSLDPTVSGPITAAPEPATFVLMASGLAGVAGFARRRRKQAA